MVELFLIFDSSTAGDRISGFDDVVPECVVVGDTFLLVSVVFKVEEDVILSIFRLLLWLLWLVEALLLWLL